MLLISRISKLEMHSEEWKGARIGRLFTSSNMHYLMGKEGLGETGKTYIRRKVFESLSGVSTDKEIDTDAVRWGLVYEPENMRQFCRIKGIDFLVTQKMINGAEGNEASTPDGLIVRKPFLDGLSYDVSTFEGKAYQHEKHLKCVLCKTTQQIKVVDPPAYWQKIHQLIVADSLNGFLSYFHPDLPIDKGGIRVVEFRKVEQAVKNVKGKDVTYYPIVEDIKLMNQRKVEALEYFNQIKEEMINIKN